MSSGIDCSPASVATSSEIVNVVRFLSDGW
jgi:hypothetical protein